ncbi:lysophospholipid acyltransferase family protein [Halobacillus salinarum]|uniref:Lysophospholipid acyltransferase family protein n=1 Tax=Halobacillus salinarum TaxID=2932257 RepID=A0ABY4EFI9_9BACI|nr:lysophospholipid acyltransferase family protein [Halobacillus salinarum]UOQ43240.1 lysophospholipid acyltransferase family protein [Halobacillus salinarum]
MRKATKNGWIEWGFKRFNRLFVRMNFHRMKVLSEAKESDFSHSLFLINHSSWWDSLILYYLNDQYVRSDGYGMMDEEGMNRFPFFSKIGVYSINTASRTHLLHSLNYSIELLNRGKTVWIFPQGEEQHLEKRPLDFFNGISYIAEKAPRIQVIPVSLYYTLEHHRKPNVYILLGEPLSKESYHTLPRKQKTIYFEKHCTEQLDRLKERIIAEDHNGFTPI